MQAHQGFYNGELAIYRGCIFTLSKALLLIFKKALSDMIKSDAEDSLDHFRFSDELSIPFKKFIQQI